MSYLFFAASLIGQCRQLEGIRVFGTDGERPLIDAFGHEFRFSQHLTCFIHVRRNIKEKLNSCNVPSEVATTICDDIFGRKLGTVFEEGLVDSVDSDDFESKWNDKYKWQQLQTTSTSSCDLDSFIKWFISNKKDTIKNTMLRSVREESGLGNPPVIFTTNSSESLNALLKHKVHYQKNELAWRKLKN